MDRDTINRIGEAAFVASLTTFILISLWAIGNIT